MASTHESGHATNVANYEQQISYCVGYGVTYNPSKVAIKTASMSTQLTSAISVQSIVNQKLNVYSAAVDAREILFEPLSVLVTKIMNALKSSEVTVQVVTDAKTLSRKLTGKRATPKSKRALDAFIDSTHEGAKTTAPADGTVIPTDPKEISSSQMGYDNRLENFSRFINLISAELGYAPNETELKVDTLNTMVTNMKAKNTAVINAITALSNARIERNKVLYKDGTGIYDVVMASKAYIKSVYGAKSPEYKQVSKLKFTKPR